MSTTGACVSITTANAAGSLLTSAGWLTPLLSTVTIVNQNSPSRGASKVNDFCVVGTDWVFTHGDVGLSLTWS